MSLLTDDTFRALLIDSPKDIVLKDRYEACSFLLKAAEKKIIMIIIEWLQRTQGREIVITYNGSARVLVGVPQFYYAIACWHTRQHYLCGVSI